MKKRLLVVAALLSIAPAIGLAASSQAAPGSVRLPSVGSIPIPPVPLCVDGGVNLIVRTIQTSQVCKEF